MPSTGAAQAQGYAPLTLAALAEAIAGMLGPDETHDPTVMPGHEYPA